VHRDDFWHRQDGGVGLADPQGHERHELAAEGAEVKALAKGVERAVSGEVPQPGVDSQEPCEGEPSGIGEGWLDRGSRAKRNRVGCTAAPEQLAGLPGSPAWSGRSAFVHAEMAQLWLLPDVLVRLAGDGGGAPPGWSGGKRYGPSGLFATERGACPQHPDRRWRVRHNPC